jgi:arylsulfatase A-like enzyme
MVSTEDLLPTLIERCGWSPAGRLRPHRPQLRPGAGGAPISGRESLVCVESTRQASLCWRTDRWKLIQPVVEDARGAPLPDIYGHPRDPAPVLFDLVNDPAETENVAARFPEVRDDLARRLAEWRAAEVAARGGSDPVLDQGLTLGYDEFMARLNARHGRSGR